MQITYPSHHRWLMDITSGLATSFEGRVGKKILSTLPLLSEANIHYHIEPLTENFFVKFLPLYTSQIQSKSNALIHDIVEKTLHNTKSAFPYYSLSITEGGTFIGGAIFSVRKDRVSYAYRTFIKEWQQAKLKAGPALIGEYAVAEFSCKRGLSYISHGKDRNPYGLNANIGLATFKLSVGCRPSISSEFEIKTLCTAALTEDCFILAMPEEGTIINKAYLVTLPQNEEHYLRATKYPDQLTVEVVYRH
jgi:hypothetical protein